MGVVIFIISLFIEFFIVVENRFNFVFKNFINIIVNRNNKFFRRIRILLFIVVKIFLIKSVF